MSEAIDPTLCPICGQSNLCGTQAGKSKCWCYSADISHQLLGELPEEIKDTSCLCERCASKDNISPCVGVCTLDELKLSCVSCGRSKDEIAAWGSMEVEDKIVVMKRVSQKDE